MRDLAPMGNPLGAVLERRAAALSTTTGRVQLAPRDSTGPRACPTEGRDLARIDPAFVALARNLAEGQRSWPLYLFGPPGSGKTSAALWMLDQYGPAGSSARCDSVIADWYAGFIRSRDLPTLIKADEGRFQASREGRSWDVTKVSLERTLQTAPLIVLDDFAVSERLSDWHLDRALQILDWRAGHNARPLIVTGNLLPTELVESHWGRDRVADRILRGSRFQMGGASKRTGIDHGEEV